VRLPFTRGTPWSDSGAATGGGREPAVAGESAKFRALPISAPKLRSHLTCTRFVEGALDPFLLWNSKTRGGQMYTKDRNKMPIERYVA